MIFRCQEILSFLEGIEESSKNIMEAQLGQAFLKHDRRFSMSI